VPAAVAFSGLNVKRVPRGRGGDSVPPVTEETFLSATRASYDTIAEAYV
jgi:hypothetical protein